MFLSPNTVGERRQMGNGFHLTQALGIENLKIFELTTIMGILATPPKLLPQ